ncbi:DUF6320 domain-containing protein [Acetivibrio clariflavus]|uniref:DUF6320 domain-containing protein n=1 Tax=Acetivibrio clariflavus TaxID=288965 RepID=UPI00047F3677|nr:DUF6320 domain-containing protein [Acetivibrio clariflavus]
MILCNHCKVYIRDGKNKCPLCGNILSHNEGINKEEAIYPEIPPAYERHLAMRILIFISVVAIVISFIIYRLFPTSVNWPVLVVMGIMSVWISIGYVLRKRSNITKTIMWQVVIMSLLSIIWDWKIGWRGWSLDYAIPFLCIAAIIVMYITAKAMRLGTGYYIAYFLLGGLFGIIPGLFILLDLVSVDYPSIISVAVSIIFLSAIIIFQGENILSELQKRMHI